MSQVTNHRVFEKYTLQMPQNLVRFNFLIREVCSQIRKCQNILLKTRKINSLKKFLVPSARKFDSN